MASSNRMRRVAKELQDIAADVESAVKAEPAMGSDVSHLKASFFGPPETPYEGGNYVIDVVIPTEYPFKPPIMKFSTKIWHPNISSVTGAICLDTLGTAWSPVLTIKSALLSLQSLLTTPEPKDPQDAEVANMLMNHPVQFQQKAREWAIIYAEAPRTTKWSQTFSPSQPGQSSPKAALTKEELQRQQILLYQGYHKDLIDRFCSMGFSVEKVVEGFNFVGIDKNDGRDYELEEAYMGDITAFLLNEP